MGKQRRWVVTVGILLAFGAPRAAFADRWGWMVGGGGIASGQGDGGIGVAAAVRAEVVAIASDRVKAGPMVALSTGFAVIDPGFGPEWDREADAGVVVTACARRPEGPCFVADAAIGYEKRGQDRTANGLVGASLDAGGARWRVRFGLGGRRAYPVFTDSTQRAHWGASLALLVMRRF